MHVALVNAPLLSAVSDHGVGHQMPLGLLMVGGALRGHVAVTRNDAACDHLTDDDIVRRVAARGADVAMVAHVGSTQAHPCCLRTMAAQKAAVPRIVTVYGGVHPMRLLLDFQVLSLVFIHPPFWGLALRSLRTAIPGTLFLRRAPLHRSRLWLSSMQTNERSTPRHRFLWLAKRSHLQLLLWSEGGHQAKRYSISFEKSLLEV